MRYRPTDGIVLVHVCDTYLLVPTRAASERCRNIAKMSGMDVIMWKGLQKGKSMEELCKIYAAFYLKTPDEIRPQVEEKLATLCQKGFLTEAEDE